MYCHPEDKSKVQKIRQPSRSHITTPTGSIPNKCIYKRYLRIPDPRAAVVLATVLANEIFLLQTMFRVFTLLLQYIIYVIIGPFYIFYASSVAVTILLLKSENAHEACNEA